MNDQSFEYRTGRTEPVKNHRGIIAFLLIAVIFLCGIISALGLMNIRLFRLLEQLGRETPLSFSQETNETLGENATTVQIAGMSCVEPGDVYRQLYDLPQGLYISHVEENSPAALAGIAPGDVLMQIGETATPDLNTLEGILTKFSQKQVSLTVNRKGETLHFDIFITGETP